MGLRRRPIGVRNDFWEYDKQHKCLQDDDAGVWQAKGKGFRA